MKTTTSIAEMQKFIFGSKVYCSDGESGVLTHIGLDAKNWRMVVLGIRLGRLFGRTVYVPFNTVASASSEKVTLTISRDELERARKDAPGAAMFDSHARVFHVESGAEGGLSLIAVYPDNGEVAYIVTKGLKGLDVLLERAYLKQLESGRIEASLPESTLQALPAYRSDQELQSEVEENIFDLGPLHIDFRGMEIRVLDSVLYLDGNISSSLRSDMVGDQAMGVAGLLEIKNRLIADDELASELAMVMSRDERTKDLPIGVYPRLGHVRLSGSVHNKKQHAAAEEIVSGFPGVQSVENELRVDPNASMLYVLSSAGNEESKDHVPSDKYVRHTK
ncbi:BON domain-containing protein [Ktedonospora formicarum]|uniref:BON domain-containing protein n=1 Tax=Ktedonospora formicarum TaxID=2778364 RepID=A0A8J3HYG8_9CHLR|nr:BON domain-containing protein [Ktedonospora formicarum]GHO42952.1 hypothetical protein KSX_11150 [Ktedonospora formicarum]